MSEDGLSILYHDPHLLAVSKPAGMPTQPSSPAARESSLQGLVRRHLSPADPTAAYLGTVHRLDTPVSGVILWALTPRAARRLAAMFQSRQVEKHYWAVVQGTPVPDSGVWDDWLCEEDTGLSRVQVCEPDTPRARHAITRYETLDTGESPLGTSRLHLWPRTGRTHQLRVQSASRGCPILGDDRYGSGVRLGDWIALHARSLRFEHPSSHRQMEIVAPLPAHWPEAGFRFE